MPDIRDVLDRAAPAVSSLDADSIGRRARRRRVVPRAAAAVGIVVLIAVGVVAFVTRGEGHVRVSTPSPTSTSTAPTTTASALPAYVDPSPADPALRSTLPRCTAADLQLLRVERNVLVSTPSLATYFTVERSDACALLSYPAVEGLEGNGTWEPIPVYYDQTEAISSYPWEGVVDPDAPGSGGAAIVTRFDSIQPSWFVGGRCPAGPLPSKHYTSLRFVLRDGGGVVELPGVEFDTSGCATALHRFGFESRDAAAVTPGS
jgi:hypothetical protein